MSNHVLIFFLLNDEILIELPLFKEGLNRVFSDKSNMHN